MTGEPLRCLDCGTPLEDADRPEPREQDGRLRFDVDCPVCGVALSVFVSIVLADNLEVKKSVRRRSDARK